MKQFTKQLFKIRILKRFTTAINLECDITEWVLGLAFRFQNSGSAVLIGLGPFVLSFEFLYIIKNYKTENIWKPS